MYVGHQVLGHLLDNAVKYSPAPGAISVVGHRTPDSVAIAIVDEGVGLPTGVDVFEAFQRGEDEHIGVAPGVGRDCPSCATWSRRWGGQLPQWPAPSGAPRSPCATEANAGGTRVDAAYELSSPPGG